MELILDLFRDLFSIDEAVGQAKKKYLEKIGQERFDAGLAADPTGRIGSFMEWIAKMINDEEIPLAEIPEKFAFLRDYLRLRQGTRLTPEEKDILRFPNVAALQQMVFNKLATEEGSEEQEKKKEAKALRKKQGSEEGSRVPRMEFGAKVIQDTDKVKVLIPYTEPSSQFFGAGGSWCTSNKDSCYWENYVLQQGKLLFIILPKGEYKTKWNDWAVLVGADGRIEQFQNNMNQNHASTGTPNEKASQMLEDLGISIGTFHAQDEDDKKHLAAEAKRKAEYRKLIVEKEFNKWMSIIRVLPEWFDQAKGKKNIASKSPKAVAIALWSPEMAATFGVTAQEWKQAWSGERRNNKGDLINILIPTNLDDYAKYGIWEIHVGETGQTNYTTKKPEVGITHSRAKSGNRNLRIEDVLKDLEME